MNYSVKIFLLTLLSLLGSLSLPVSAQQTMKFSIDHFELDPFDLTAKNKDYQKYDGSGSLYAIIKVTSNNPNDNLNEYHFNFGYLNSFVENHGDELWVYVQENAKRVTISRKNYATINKHDLGLTIQAGKTYVMSLNSFGPTIFTQMVMFEISPADARAVVMVQRQGGMEELFGIEDETGAVAKSLPFGTYTYKVTSENYKLSEGRFTLNSEEVNHVEKVVLRPNFSNVTLQVNADAEIFVNREKKGVRTWKGTLKAGNYQVECRKKGHQPSKQFITILENQDQTLDLTPPTPIVGTLAVTSTPLGAEIWVDGQKKGITPLNVNNLLIGEHELVLRKDNYNEEKRSFEIRERQTTEMHADLSDRMKVTLNSRPSGAELYVDGKHLGTTPRTVEVAAGYHDVRMILREYQEMERKVLFERAQVEYSYGLKRQLSQSNHFYVDAGFAFGTVMEAGANIGGYLKCYNVEGFFDYGLSKETFYGNSSVNDPQTDEVGYYRFGARIGYGFVFGNKFRLTPQVGVACLSVQGDQLESNALSALAGAKCEYLLNSHWGFTFSAEGMFGLKKGDVYEIMSDKSSMVKGWATGVNVRAGVKLYF